MSNPGVIHKGRGKEGGKINPRVLQGIKLILVVGLFTALFWVIPFQDVFKVIKTAQPGLLVLGIALGLPNVYMKSVRLGLLTRKQGLPITFNRLFVVNLMVKFYLLFLPGTLIGSGIRWAKISPSGKSAESLAAVAFNRFIETFITILAGVFWFVTGIGQEKINLSIVFAFLVSIIFGWLLFIKLSIYLTQRFDHSPEKISSQSVRQFIWNYSKRTIKSLSLYARLSIKDLSLLIGVGIMSYLVGFLSYIMIARSIGIDISIFHLGWTRSAVLLAALLPLSIAGGLGIREVSLVVLLSFYGVESEVALAFSLLLFSRNIFLSLIGGFLELCEIFANRRENQT